MARKISEEKLSDILKEVAGEAASKNVQVDGSAVHVNKIAESRADTGAILEAIRRIEAKTVSGAPSRSPMEQTLAYSETVQKALDEAGANRNVRWVAIGNPVIMESRKHQGYTVLPESEGGRRLGNDLAVATCPKELREDRARHAEKLHRARLEDSGKQILLAELDKTARELRDRHGIKVSPERLLNSEED